MTIAITNSLIKYICNLTIGKKNYEDVQQEVIKIKDEAEILKIRGLEIIDKDKQILEEILKAYKTRKENPKELEEVNKNAVEFCMSVTEIALETLKLAIRIEKVGNKMLSSDFKICKYYAFCSIEASVANVDTNLEGIKDMDFVSETKAKYDAYYDEAKKMIFLQ